MADLSTKVLDRKLYFVIDAIDSIRNSSSRQNSPTIQICAQQTISNIQVN